MGQGGGACERCGNSLIESQENCDDGDAVGGRPADPGVDLVEYVGRFAAPGSLPRQGEHHPRVTDVDVGVVVRRLRERGRQRLAGAAFFRVRRGGRVDHVVVQQLPLPIEADDLAAGSASQFDRHRIQTADAVIQRHSAEDAASWHSA